MKLICISNNSKEISKIKRWAVTNKVPITCYSPKRWSSLNKGRAAKNTPYLSKIIPFVPPRNKAFCTSMKDIKVQIVQQALVKTGGNAVSAAKILKISRATLYRVIQQHNIDMESIRQYDQATAKPIRFKKSA